MTDRISYPFILKKPFSYLSYTFLKKGFTFHGHYQPKVYNQTHMGKFNFNEADFEDVKERAEAFYTAIGPVHCPYFGDKVTFNTKGIKHLKFKSDEVARTREDQYSRLKLVRYAPDIIKLSRTVQGVWQTKKFEMQKTHSRWERVLKDVTFYEFMAVLDNVRIKVIVKQVAGGEKHFWSVIPFWKINKETKRRILHTGDPEND